jgi:cytochrome c oxidase subunit I
MLDGTPQALVHMPHQSPWPLILTVAMLTFLYGILIDAYVVAAIGAVGSAAGLIGWFYPRGETQET